MYTGDTWFDKKGDTGAQTFYCVVGNVIEICHPRFVKGAVTIGGKKGEALRGFRLVHPKLGTIEEGDKWNCIKYHHNKSGQQIIEFIEDLGLRRSYLVMNSITVHDHASIPMGGPAYATYYSESE